ncbi:BnaC01g20680D [Brassica napus]|uniref:BnaC01g20680D protein n=1 Tax=Brassica napus TaxID=3708 RepID=A0A078FX73_BRANA|nr:BnaC01g20680D [Brassica napus]
MGQANYGYIKRTLRSALFSKKRAYKVRSQLRDSCGTWSDSEDKQKYGNLGATLDQLAASVLDGPLQKRKPQLTKTQVYPYVGNSTVKRIIKGDVSKAYYDPLAKVVETKFKKLLHYLRMVDVDTLLYEANNAKKCVGNLSFWVAVRLSYGICNAYVS